MSDIPLSALARIPWLLLRLVFSALRFKRKAIKSARKARKGMIKGGMDRKMAIELTRRYEESFSVRRLINRVSGKRSGFSSLFSFL